MRKKGKEEKLREEDKGRTSKEGKMFGQGKKEKRKMRTHMTGNGERKGRKGEMEKLRVVVWGNERRLLWFW